MPATNWLVSSAGRRGHLVSILRTTGAATGGGAVVAVDASALSAAGLLADDFALVPRADDPTFVERVMAVCDRHAIDYVLPTIDPELPVYAANRSQFEARGHEVWISTPEVVALGRDKWLFHNWLAGIGLDSPATAEVRAAPGAGFDGPVIAKPRDGSSSVGLIHAAAFADLRTDELGDAYIVQEQLTGYEVTVDFAVDRTGELLGISARRRLEVRGGEVSKAVTIDHPRVRTAVERMIAALPGAFGVLNVQVIVDDPAGRVSFIELNPRIGGGFPLSWQAGVQFLSTLAAGPGATPSRVDARPGVVMLRYDDAVFEEAALFGSELQ